MLFSPHKLGLHKVLQYIPLGAVLDAPFEAAVQKAVQKAVNIAHLRVIAQQRSHRMVFDYLDGSAGDEITLCRNKDVFSEIDMHCRVLARNSTKPWIC
mmetsp:Transcript_16087/g.30623  ORF Transcript_16087/g.30623 Transcript_16087/m.30623 type:complete len:98 (-) Transcript_16087:507-800(-)